MTDGIKAAKHELRQAECQWRDTRLTVHREIYTKQWGVVKTLVRAARKLHLSARIGNCSNTRQLFSLSNGLLGKSKTTPLPSDIPRSALQDRFCVFFYQKIQNIRQDLDAHPSEPATFSAYDGPKLCLFQPVTEEEIRKLIVESPTKTCMLDPIPTSLTKECLSDLLPLITRIVNSSLCSGAIPPQFKQAVVTPLLKKPGLDPNDLKNFWPVSNLLFISKIQVKVVLTQLQKHLSENDLLEIRQPAYWKNHSTETALLSIVDGLLRNADDRLVSVLALLDLSAAFDMLDHPILLQRLETTFDISGTVFWFALFRGPWTVCEGWQHLVLSQPPSVWGSTGFSPWANPVHIVLSAPLWLNMSPRVWLSQIRWCQRGLLPINFSLFSVISRPALKVL